MLPVPELTNAVTFAPLSNCNLPATLIDFANPAPPETTNPPVVDDVELSVELNVAFPVEAPIDNTVAAPKAFIVVAVVLNTANVALFVVTPVPNEGDELKTNEPDPVSSDKTEAIAEEVVDADTVPEETVNIPVDPLKFCPVPPYVVETAVPFQVPRVIEEFENVTPTILAPIPPTYKLPPIPTPPVTLKAPLLKSVETVEWVMLTTPVAVLLVKVFDPITESPVPG